MKVTQLTDAVERTPDKRKLTFKEKEEFKQLENELESLEQEKVLLTTQLSAGELSGEAVMNVGQRLSEVVDLLEKKSDRWLELSEFV